MQIIGQSPYFSKTKSVLTELPENGVLLQEVEKELIMKTLELTKGNKVAAAGLLGMTRRRLYLRLSQYDGSQPQKCHAT